MEQIQEETFSGITSISVEGGGSINIESTGLINVEPKATILKKGSTLSIKFIGGSGGSVIMMGGGNFIGNMVSFGGSSTIISNGNTIIMKNGQVFMNGKLMVPAGEAKEEKKEEPKKIYRLSLDTKIQIISIIGSGKIENIPPEMLSTNLELDIAGSGDINLPHAKIGKLVGIISGSGDIDCGNSHIIHGQFKISGSGDISNFHILESARVSVSGSGDIRGTKMRGADIDQSSSGSGKIKITTI